MNPTKRLHLAVLLLASFGCLSVTYGGADYYKPVGASQSKHVSDSRLLPGLISLPGRGIFFRPGATMEEVTLVMGAPTQKRGSLWYYGDSTVQFSRTVRVPVVTGYEIKSVPLRIFDKDPFFTP